MNNFVDAIGIIVAFFLGQLWGGMLESGKERTRMLKQMVSLREKISSSS